MSRNLERSMARALYAKFAKRWRQEQRLAGVYGQPGYKRPKFNEWYQLHQQHVLEQAQVHAPAADLQYDEVEAASDPWADLPIDISSIQMDENKEERGVVTMDIGTGEEEGNG